VKKFDYLIGLGTNDLPVSSIGPHSSTLALVPIIAIIIITIII
jgi:hypothetical protein